MSWTPKPLGEILQQSGSHRAGDRDFPVLSITMKHGLVDQADKFKKRIASTDTSNYRIAYKNELVVGFPIDEGVLGFQTKYPAGIVSPAYDIWKLKNEAECHIPYLERYLRSPQARSLYASRMQGAVARRRSLTKADFIKLEIPFPPLDDQIRIAHLLGKVERLIAQHKLHLQHLDDLLKSVFLEMFGDPVRNEKGWDKRPCSNVAEIITGNPFKSDLYTKDQTQLRLCGGLIIYPQRIEWEKCNYWPKEYLSGLERYFLEVDDIVLAMDRPWISSGLKVCTVDEIGRGSLLVQRTARLRANDMEQLFLYAHMKDASFTKHCKPTETTVPHISIKDIQTFQVLCPPKQLQIKFSSIAKKIESLKSRYQHSLADLESLYGVLSQQAFKGELDLSRVPIPGTKPEEEKAVVTEPLQARAEQGLAINLPDTDNLPDALENAEARGGLITQWLEAYCRQLGSTPFSVQHFMAAAQTRLAELHPETDFELGVNDYEHIKTWVFEALADGRLQQSRDITRHDESGEPIFGNLIEIKSGSRP